jgi:hypothetical protein
MQRCNAVRFLRSRLTAIACATIATTLAAHVVLTGASPHVLCAAARHDCGSTARIAACCCGENTETSRASGPVVPAVRVAPTPAAAPIAHHLIPRVRPPLPTEGARVPALPDDLTILLANLRV